MTKLLRYIVCFALFGFSVSAFAGQAYFTINQFTQLGIFVSAEAACHTQDSAFGQDVFSAAVGGQCKWKEYGTGTIYAQYNYSAYTCPGTTVIVNGTCAEPPITCPDMEHQMVSTSGQCYTPNCSNMGSPAYYVWNRTANACVSPPPPAQCSYGSTDGGVDPATNIRKCIPRVCPYPSVLKSDGTCGADDTPKPDLVCPSGTHKNMAGTRCEPNPKDEPDPCPAGTHNISANAAMPNCTSDARPPDKPPEVTKTDTKVQPDGTTTKTETTQGSASNNDGTATITTTITTTSVNTAGQPVGAPTVVVRKTTVLDGSGTPGASPGRPTGTVTTATAGDGSQTTSTTKGTAPGDNPDAKETDLCKLHPTLNICKNSSVSGDCENLVCEGDAIQCAILRQQKKEYCDNIKDNPLKTLGDQLLNGNDPLKATLPTPQNGTEVTINGNIEAAGWLGGGACIADKTFPLVGRTIVIPFSRVCDGLVAFRLAVMLMALMASFRMISGAILRA